MKVIQKKKMDYSDEEFLPDSRAPYCSQTSDDDYYTADEYKNKKFQEMVQKEMEYWNYLSADLHANLCNYYCHLNKQMMYYIVSELCDESLRELILRSGPMHPSEVKKVIFEVLCGLDYMHSRGIAHYDLKPANILKTSEGIHKIGDFGLCRLFIIDATYLYLKSFRGTNGFAAPEIFNKYSRGDQCDIWSIGVTVYNLLTVEMPWNAATPRHQHFIDYCSTGTNEALNKMDRWCSGLVKAMLVIDADHRPSIAGLVDDLFPERKEEYVAQKIETIPLNVSVLGCSSTDDKEICLSTKVDDVKSLKLVLNRNDDCSQKKYVNSIHLNLPLSIDQDSVKKIDANKQN